MILDYEKYKNDKNNKKFKITDYIFINNKIIYHYQEWTNAWSMCLPSILCFYYIIFPPYETFWNRYTSLMVAGTFSHLPFSFTYHSVCAINIYSDNVNCIWRKLDQTFIHIVSMFYSYALSGDELYGIGNVVLNSWYIVRLWIPGNHDNCFERRSNIAMSVIMYTLPMLFRGDYINYIAASMCWGISAVLFIGNKLLNGWGHSLFHICMLIAQYFLLKSAVSVI